MGDAVRGAGAGAAGGEHAVWRQPGKALREKKKAGSKKKKLPDAENSPLNNAASAEPQADALEGGIEGTEDGRDSDNEVVLMHGPLRAQEMPESVVGDLNETVDKAHKGAAGSAAPRDYYGSDRGNSKGVHAPHGAEDIHVGRVPGPDHDDGQLRGGPLASGTRGEEGRDVEALQRTWQPQCADCQGQL